MPAWLQTRRRPRRRWWPSWLKERAMKVIYTDVLVIGGGLAGLRMAIGRQAARPRRDHPVAGAGQALAQQGRAGRHAGHRSAT
ncbi:MAG: hypothetical protein MZV64_44770 [Ignavibacteriales bacterium]|nr:hypothetical protein [Ignavibacteriales bacterium]